MILKNFIFWNYFKTEIKKKRQENFLLPLLFKDD